MRSFIDQDGALDPAGGKMPMPGAPSGLSKMHSVSTGGRYAPGRKLGAPPVNSHKRAEYERQQQLLQAIHEQEKMEYMKRLLRLQAKERRQAQKKLEIKE